MNQGRFVDIVREELQERGWSMAELARRTQREAGWPRAKSDGGPRVTMAALLRGVYPPTVEAMEAVAGVFRIDPDRFLEYEPQRLRDELNLHTHSLDQVRAALERDRDR